MESAKDKRDREIILSVVEALTRLRSEAPENIPLPGCDSDSDEIKKLCDTVSALLRSFADVHDVLSALAESDSDLKPSSENNSALCYSLLRLLKEKTRIEDELKASNHKFRAIMSVLGEGVYVLDRYGQLVFMNPEAESLLGWKAKELLGGNFHEVVHCQRADGTRMSEAECPVVKAINSGNAYHSAEDSFTRKDGRMIPVSFVSTPLIENDVVMGSVAAFHDITEQIKYQDSLKRLNEVLELQATTDRLTGIYNRSRLEDYLTVEAKRAMRHKTPQSLIMFDIDYFKNINDTYGHEAGDRILIEIAKLVRENLRTHDVLARWGGDEFMVLSPNTAVEAAALLAEKLRKTIENHRFPAVKKVTCSFGLTQFDENDALNGFIKRADNALYLAKERGRNRVETA